MSFTHGNDVRYDNDYLGDTNNILAMIKDLKFEFDLDDIKVDTRFIKVEFQIVSEIFFNIQNSNIIF